MSMIGKIPGQNEGKRPWLMTREKTRKSQEKKSIASSEEIQEVRSGELPGERQG